MDKRLAPGLKTSFVFKYDDWDYKEEFADDEGNEIEQNIDDVKEFQHAKDDTDLQPEDSEEATETKKEAVKDFLRHTLCPQKF